MAQKEKPTFDPPVDGGVVIGYDGSSSAEAALRWAVDEARWRGLELHVVRTWVLSSAMRDMEVPFGAVPSFDECAEAMSAAVAKATEAARDGVTVHGHVHHGPPAPALVAASETARLLVVGHRGRGGFGGLVLGSVAEQVMRHASCSVVVVR